MRQMGNMQKTVICKKSVRRLAALLLLMGVVVICLVSACTPAYEFDNQTFNQLTGRNKDDFPQTYWREEQSLWTIFPEGIPMGSVKVGTNTDKATDTNSKPPFTGELTLSDGRTPVFFGGGGIREAVLVSIDGEAAWELDPQADYLYMVIDVDDIDIGADIGNLSVTVTYYDSGGMFTLQNYTQHSTALLDTVKTNRVGNVFDVGEQIVVLVDPSLVGTDKIAAQAEVVELSGENAWKDYTFELSDVVLDNSIVGGDFWVAAYVPSKGQVSSEPIYIKDVKVSGTPSKQGVQSSVDQAVCVLKDQQTSEVVLTKTVRLSNEEEPTVLLDIAAPESGTFILEITPVDGSRVQVRRGMATKPEASLSLTVRAPVPSRNPGLGVNTHWGKGWVQGASYQEKTELITGAGFGWARDEMEWSLAETEKGVVQVLPRWDAYIDALIAQGIEPLIILNYGNEFYDQGGAPYTQEGIDGYVNYVRTIVSHFKGRVNHFEIWNEYNMVGTAFNPTSRTPKDYAKMLKATYTAIKEINPQATVIGGATAGVDVDWLSAILQEGAADYMDAVSFHPYCYPSDPESGHVVEAMEYMTSMFRQLKLDLPIWITEIGWPTHEGPYGVGEEVAGDNLVKSYVQLLTIPGVEKVFWYALEDDGDNSAEPEANFGLLRNWNSAQSSQAKAGYLAASTMNSFLADAQYVGKYRNESTVVYQYRSGGVEILVAWNNKGSDRLMLKADNVTVYNLQGSAINQNRQGGISIGTSPVIITGKGIIR